MSEISPFFQKFPHTDLPIQNQTILKTLKKQKNFEDTIYQRFLVKWQKMLFLLDDDSLKVGEHHFDCPQWVIFLSEGSSLFLSTFLLNYVVLNTYLWQNLIKQSANRWKMKKYPSKIKIRMVSERISPQCKMRSIVRSGFDHQLSQSRKWFHTWRCKDWSWSFRLWQDHQFSVQQVFALWNWDSFKVWNILIFEVVKLCRMKK